MNEKMLKDLLILQSVVEEAERRAAAQGRPDDEKYRGELIEQILKERHLSYNTTKLQPGDVVEVISTPTGVRQRTNL